MIIAYTGAYERFVASLTKGAEPDLGRLPGAPHSLGTWVPFSERVAHVHELVTQITEGVAEEGLDVRPLAAAWALFRERFPFEAIEGETPLRSAERWQSHIVAALRELRTRANRPGTLNRAGWSRDFHDEVRKAIVNALRRQPEGAAEAMAAWMVPAASTPTEVDEGVNRLMVEMWVGPSRIRELERSVDGIKELWYLGPTRHASLAGVELAVVELDCPVIPDPEAPDRIPDEQAILNQRAPPGGRATALGGERDGEDLGSWSSDSPNFAASTTEAVKVLAQMGSASSPPEAPGEEGIAPSPPKPGPTPTGGGGSAPVPTTDEGPTALESGDQHDRPVGSDDASGGPTPSEEEDRLMIDTLVADIVADADMLQVLGSIVDPDDPAPPQGPRPTAPAGGGAPDRPRTRRPGIGPAVERLVDGGPAGPGTAAAGKPRPSAGPQAQATGASAGPSRRRAGGESAGLPRAGEPAAGDGEGTSPRPPRAADRAPQPGPRPSASPVANQGRGKPRRPGAAGPSEL